MELQEVFEKIDEIAGEFIDKLDANFYSGASVTELNFSFYVEQVGGLETERLLITLPISDLETNPVKLWAAWKKVKTVLDKEQKANYRNYEKMIKDPVVKEFLEILGKLGPYKI
jgi:hypothetical protein